MEILPIEYSDLTEINSIVKKSSSVVTTNTMKELLEHFKEDSLALKCIEGTDIVGIWFSKEFETYISLSYFYTDESIRRKPQVIVFFKTCVDALKSTKPLLIISKDTSTFARYVEPLGGDVYRFKGFR